MLNLINDDCLRAMDKLIEDGVKVDAIITDIPQEITQNSWDNIIPFKEMWNRLYKLRKDKSTPIVLFSNQPFTTLLISSNINHFRYMQYWKKDRPSNFLNAKRQPLRDVEEIVIFYEKQCTYNPQMFEGKPLHGMGTKFKTKRSENNNYGEFSSENNPSALRQGDTSKYPRQLLEFSKPHPPQHPTQKPIELMEYLIKMYTNEGDTVLDFTAGSGTTGLACLNTHRHFIGIELDDKYFKLMEDRLNGITRD